MKDEQAGEDRRSGEGAGEDTQSKLEGFPNDAMLVQELAATDYSYCGGFCGGERCRRCGEARRVLQKLAVLDEEGAEDAAAAAQLACTQGRAGAAGAAESAYPQNQAEIEQKPVDELSREEMRWK